MRAASSDCSPCCRPPQRCSAPAGGGPPPTCSPHPAQPHSVPHPPPHSGRTAAPPSGLWWAAPLLSEGGGVGLQPGLPPAGTLLSTGGVWSTFQLYVTKQGSDSFGPRSVATQRNRRVTTQPVVESASATQ